MNCYVQLDDKFSFITKMNELDSNEITSASEKNASRRNFTRNCMDGGAYPYPRKVGTNVNNPKHLQITKCNCVVWLK